MIRSASSYESPIDNEVETSSFHSIDVHGLSNDQVGKAASFLLVIPSEVVNDLAPAIDAEGPVLEARMLLVRQSNFDGGPRRLVVVVDTYPRVRPTVARTASPFGINFILVITSAVRVVLNRPYKE
mmetsp:Transcript_53031/g.79232  ORF Transcript_53031/g.79232 Transcript_53031/m.79232 type:complete len:126 (-) Transcript_53031:39-416(-)